MNGRTTGWARDGSSRGSIGTNCNDNTMKDIKDNMIHSCSAIMTLYLSYIAKRQLVVVSKCWQNF
jgi:hypothetical protein